METVFGARFGRLAQFCDFRALKLFIGVDSSESGARVITSQNSIFHGQVAELTKMIFERRPPDFGGLRGSLQRILNEIPSVKKKILKEVSDHRNFRTNDANQNFAWTK